MLGIGKMTKNMGILGNTLALRWRKKGGTSKTKELVDSSMTMSISETGNNSHISRKLQKMKVKKIQMNNEAWKTLKCLR